MSRIRVNLKPSLRNKSQRPSPISLILALILGALISLSAKGATQTSDSLRSLKDKNSIAIANLEREIRQVFDQVRKNSEVNLTIVDQELLVASEKFARLFNEKRERLLREELLDRLISLMDKNPKSKLHEILENLSNSEVLGTDPTLLIFLSYLSTALKKIPEPIEDPLNFFEIYLQYSSILDPKPLSEFRSHSGYINDDSMGPQKKPSTPPLDK